MGMTRWSHFEYIADTVVYTLVKSLSLIPVRLLVCVRVKKTMKQERVWGQRVVGACVCVCVDVDV